MTRRTSGCGGSRARRRSSARRSARSRVTAIICRAMSVGGDGTRDGNTSGEGDGDKRRACKIGDELLEGDSIEGRRWGVGDIGDVGRLSSLGGVGGVVITGEEYGIFSCSSSACASSSYKRTRVLRAQFKACGKPGKNCSPALPFVRGQLSRASKPHFLPQIVVERG